MVVETQTQTLAEFLLARIAEDEAAARAATPGPWRWEEPSTENWPTADESLVSDGKRDEGGYPESVLYAWGYDAYGINGSDADRAHIARHDPARVLADCEAKRRIVGLMRERHPHYDWLRATDEERGEDRMHGLVGRLLALPYADHPDYRAEWRP